MKMRAASILAASLAAIALTGGVAAAQSAPNNGETMGAAGARSGAPMSGNTDKGMTGSGGMNMSASDKATLKSCEAMAQDAMMRNPKCKAMVAKRPDMFNSDGSKKSDVNPE